MMSLRPRSIADGIDEKAAIHCMIPQKSTKVVSVVEFHSSLAEAKNKGQRLRACLRTLSSMGYLAGLSASEREKIQEYLDDFRDSND